MLIFSITWLRICNGEVCCWHSEWRNSLSHAIMHDKPHTETQNLHVHNPTSSLILTWKGHSMLCKTLCWKSLGNVLAPVRRCTKKDFQLLYLNCIAKTKNANSLVYYCCTVHNKAFNQLQVLTIMNNALLGGTSGFPIVAHHPTAWTSCVHKLHQKSQRLSSPKPSYRSAALYPATLTTWKQVIIGFLIFIPR